VVPNGKLHQVLVVCVCFDLGISTLRDYLFASGGAVAVGSSLVHSLLTTSFQSVHTSEVSTLRDSLLAPGGAVAVGSVLELLPLVGAPAAIAVGSVLELSPSFG
jgi:hypothetical protein